MTKLTTDFNGELVVVHGGQAHRDEFLCCCLMLALFPSIKTIARRNPTPRDMSNPDVAVLDVGMRLDPDNMNFDHHQLPRDAEPACALTMFLDYMGLLQKFRDAFGWVDLTARMDSKGPYATAIHLGVDPDAVFGLSSPVEGALLRQFEAEAEIEGEATETGTKGHLLFSLMHRLGNGWLEGAETMALQLAWLEENAGIVEVNGVPGLVIPSANTMGVEKFRQARAEGAAFSVSFDDRGPGMALYRFDDDPRIDFAKINGHEAVEFAHVGGFIAKTKARLEQDDLQALIAASLV